MMNLVIAADLLRPGKAALNQSINAQQSEYRRDFFIPIFISPSEILSCDFGLGFEVWARYNMNNR